MVPPPNRTGTVTYTAVPFGGGAPIFLGTGTLTGLPIIFDAPLSFQGLTPGPYNVFGHYDGDGTYQPSLSPGRALLVIP